jgi:hypothetical protein
VTNDAIFHIIFHLVFSGRSVKFILNVFTSSQGLDIRMYCGMDRIGSLGFCSKNYPTYILMGSLPIIVSLLSL